MIEVGIGVSTQKDPIRAAEEATAHARKGFNKKIDLVIVFSSIDLACHPLLLTINNLLGAVPLVGASSLAIITNQGIFKHGVVIVLLSLSIGAHCRVACVKDIRQSGGLAAGQQLAERLLQGLSGMHRNLSVMFSDGLIEGGSDLVLGLQELLGSSFPLVGASASDNLTFQKTYIYYNAEILTDAVCGILWGGKLSFGLGISHGWEPIGKPRNVTKSSGNVVYTIEDEPAVKIYEGYFGKDASELKKDLRHISILYPIGIYLPGEEEYLLRNLLSVEDDGSLVFQGSVPEGSSIRLMIGTKEACLDATQRALEEAKRGLRGLQSKLVLVFDSVSRYTLLGRRAKQELEIIQAGFGSDTPVVGLYTYGEQAPLRSIDYLGKPYFHNQTIAILAIAE